MSPGDYDEVIALWRNTEITIVSDSDSRPAIAQYLERNPGMSYIARDAGQLVAAALCGHDGRRGYLHHLAVAKSHRRLGIATALVDRCLAALRFAGIAKCHLFVFQHNPDGMTFWQRAGWNKREDLILMSRTL
jgi:ribosomal protein S18 acetylase RimI-like enzyme